MLHVSLRDLAPEILLAATNVVDDVEHCLKADTSPHLAEQLTGNRDFLDGTLDDVMAGRVTVPADRPVVFSPFGLGVLDLAVGKFVYDQVAALRRTCTSSTTSSTSCAGTDDDVDGCVGTDARLRRPRPSPCGGTGTCCRSPTVRCGTPCRSAGRRCCPPPRCAGAGLPRLWIKDETRNPTASNKDRATALVIEDGLRRGLGTITTASTGNAAVSTAFGAAAAGLRAVIFVSTDCQPDKLALMTQAGAWVFQVPEGYAAAVDLSRAAARTFGWLDRNTGANPITLEAKKTVAFEVWEQLDAGCPT